MLGRARCRGEGPANGYSFRGLVLTVPFLLWSGCSLQQPLQGHFIGDLGRIENRKAQPQSNGVVVGVPHGTTEPAAVRYASRIVESTGAGIVVAYGFSSKRIAVSQPLVRTVALQASPADPQRPVSIYPEFKAALRSSADGPVKFYIGVRMAGKKADLKRIEVATSGFSFAQVQALKEAFARIRDREIEGRNVAKFDIAMDPLDALSWNIDGFKNHGVLMLAERGLSLRLPASLSNEPAETAYGKIFSQWTRTALALAETGFAVLPRLQVTKLPYGKIELIASARRSAKGIVVAAPHGTFDAYTAGMVRRICTRNGLAGVVATGFTPTESGDGWRINVNRPTERRVNVSDREIKTERAARTYKAFRETVLTAAQGKLELYFDIHQNGGQRIEVATVGISKDEAKFVKSTYRRLRDEMLANRPDIAVVDLAIEPLDNLEVGAWAAKTIGILSLAKKSLHFELPADGIMGTESQREIYTRILTELVGEAANRIVTTSDTQISSRIPEPLR